MFIIIINFELLLYHIITNYLSNSYEGDLASLYIWVLIKDTKWTLWDAGGLNKDHKLLQNAPGNTKKKPFSVL